MIDILSNPDQKHYKNVKQMDAHDYAIKAKEKELKNALMVGSKIGMVIGCLMDGLILLKVETHLDAVGKKVDGEVLQIEMILLVLIVVIVNNIFLFLLLFYCYYVSSPSYYYK